MGVNLGVAGRPSARRPLAPRVERKRAAGAAIASHVPYQRYAGKQRSGPRPAPPERAYLRLCDSACRRIERDRMRLGGAGSVHGLSGRTVWLCRHRQLVPIRWRNQHNWSRPAQCTLCRRRRHESADRRQRHDSQHNAELGRRGPWRRWRWQWRSAGWCKWLNGGERRSRRR